MPGLPLAPEVRVDVAVVGAGAAGLYAALWASRHGARVALVSRSPLAESASYWAQGGIAAALGGDDSVERHTDDTLAAGRGLSRPSAALALCADSPDRVRDLEGLGVGFDLAADGSRALGLEGGHSARRVVHAGGSATGRRITRELSALAAMDASVQVLEGLTASGLVIDDGRCVGLEARPTTGARGATVRALARGGARRVLARGTLLATGGAAALWERTTNPRGAIGAGLTLALAAGAEVADLEMVQFHPTALVGADGYDGFLISEAVRGEGALLLDASGERFVDELAPRDRVASAIHRRLAEGEGPVSLDMRGTDLGHFPNVVATLRRAGLEPASESVPVAPAAHYTMGGVATDPDGRSSIPGLLAVGESACTGVHGANRLASNSLAECFVVGRRAAEAALELPPPAASSAAPAPTPSPVPPAGTRSALWRLAGIERSAEGLVELARDPFPLARIVAAGALAREESRGAHRRLDHPDTDPALDGSHTVAADPETTRLERWE